MTMQGPTEGWNCRIRILWCVSLLCTNTELALLVYCLVKLTEDKLQCLIHLLNEFFLQVTSNASCYSLSKFVH